MNTSQVNDTSTSPSTTTDRDPYLQLKHGAIELYLIRHGDALPDAAEVSLEGSYNGQSLSALGRKQAQALVDRLQEVGPVAIYSSHIARAHQTALPSATALRLEIQVDRELREIEVGPIGPDLPPNPSPHDIAQNLRARLNAIATIALTTGLWSEIPGSESGERLRARATAAISRIAAAHPGQRVAIVSHGGLINAYIAAMLGIERDYFFPCANASISIVRIKDDRRLLLTLNEVAHLRQAGLL